MYIATPYPNVVYALDLAAPGAPIALKFEAKPDAFAQGVACCDVVNRGTVYADGRIFVNTLENSTIALDARTGKVLWRYRSGDVRTGETRIMAPLVVRDRVLVGNGGSEFGVRGWLSARDSASGREVWRAYSTGPDRDVLIGGDYRPFYAKEKGADLGVSTWPRDAWKWGGGTAGSWISYDPDLDLIYSGTAKPAPGNAEQWPGRQQVHVRSFRAHGGERRSPLVLSAHSARRVPLRRRQREHPSRPRFARRCPQDARPSRQQRLRVRDRSHDGRSDLGRAVRPRHELARSRARYRDAALHARPAAADGHRRSRYLPVRTTCGLCHAMLHTSALGALLTFAPTVWYASGQSAPFGLTPLEDQQLGGLVMWVPGGLGYMIAGLAIVARWLTPAWQHVVKRPAVKRPQRPA